MNITFNYAGKVVIVTGCASGIGRAIALGFGKAGAKVIAADINEKGAQETVEMINVSGGSAEFTYVNIMEEDSVQTMVENTVNKDGAIDILVNNAGVIGAVKGFPLTGLSGDDWDKNYKINLRGLFFSCKAVYDIMKNQLWGKIINVASISGKTGDASDLAFMEYSCMKSAAIHFTQLLSKELGPYNINVNCICPGFVYTPLYDSAAPLLIEKYPELFLKDYSGQDVVDKCASEWCALKRPQTPEDMANTVMFLASDEAANITGQAINVCGGCETH